MANITAEIITQSHTDYRTIVDRSSNNEDYQEARSDTDELTGPIEDCCRWESANRASACAPM